MTERLTEVFDQQVRAWIASACDEWSFDTPVEPLVDLVKQRLPAGIRGMIGLGIERGIVLPEGHTFRLKGLALEKGPYKWLSRYNVERRPNPNWEYYVQVAEYVRLCLLTENRDFQLSFEDDLMDIGVYQDGQLIVRCEVKEISLQAARLLSGIKRYQSGVDWTEPDRGNDPLRKAKYLLKRKPKFFYLVAIGTRHEFSVVCTDGSFELQADLIPLY